MTSDNERELTPAYSLSRRKGCCCFLWHEIMPRCSASGWKTLHKHRVTGTWKDRQPQSALPSSFSIKMQVQNKVQIEVRYLPVILLVLSLHFMIEVAGCLTELHQAIPLQCSTVCRLQSPYKHQERLGVCFSIAEITRCKYNTLIYGSELHGLNLP